MSRGHGLHFYATKADQALVVGDVAANLAVKYAVDEWRIKPDFRVYHSPMEAPDFELFKWPRSPGTTFFVLPDNCDLPFSHMPKRQVPEKYGFLPSSIDEPPNYRWVQYHPSGHFQSDQREGLIQGWLATNSEHPDSLAIFNAFKKSIQKRFEYFPYSGVYVGPDAVKYFDSGGRLIQDLRRPKESDAKRAST